MTDGVVQVPSGGTGAKFDTSELTVGGNTVERARHVTADPSNAAGLAGVVNTAPAGTEYGQLVREAQMGADGGAAPAVPTGGTGVRGWLASVVKVLQGTLAVAQVKGVKSTPTAVGVTTTATLLLAANASRKNGNLANNSGQTLFIGRDNTVTIVNGYPVPPGGTVEDLDSTDAWWGVVAATNADVRVLEVA